MLFWMKDLHGQMNMLFPTLLSSKPVKMTRLWKDFFWPLREYINVCNIASTKGDRTALQMDCMYGDFCLTVFIYIAMAQETMANDAVAHVKVPLSKRLNLKLLPVGSQAPFIAAQPQSVRECV